jgi:hypothetical protein
MVEGEEGDDEAPAGDEGLEEGSALRLETVLSQVGGKGCRAPQGHMHACAHVQLMSVYAQL